MLQPMIRLVQSPWYVWAGIDHVRRVYAKPVLRHAHMKTFIQWLWYSSGDLRLRHREQHLSITRRCGDSRKDVKC